MTTIAIDTNVLIDMFHGDETFRKVLASADRLLVSPVVYAEFMAGFDETRAGRAAKDRFRKFLERPMVFLPSIGRDTADLNATIRRQLKQAGTLIPQNDVWIAAQTMEYGAVLCTRDDDFKAVTNLRLVPEE